MPSQLAIVFLLSSVLLNAESAKILAIFNYPSKSHHVLGRALSKVLAARGHQVTMISPYPPTTPVENYEDLVLTGISHYKSQNVAQGLVQMQESSLLHKIARSRKNIFKMDKMFLDHPVLEELLASNRSYDLVIQNWCFNSATLGIADHFKAPVIAFSTFGSSIFLNRITGNSGPYSYVPHIFLPFPSEMTFLQRVGNTLGTLLFEIYEYIDNEMHERHLKKYFPKAPPLQQLLENVSLVLTNSHFSIENPRPYVPNMIPIGGFHVDEPKELTGELKTFFDNAIEGVLYFSFGTNVKAADLPKDKLEGIVKSFRKLPLKVLWKFENDMTNLPPNVRISKWFPQRDILAHPNTKVFVSHGGLLSTIEAVYHGVPVVGIPFFVDQEYNIANSVAQGYAIEVSYNDLNEETLTAAVKEILSNSRYRENVKMRSVALKDQPLKPMDTAIFWIEYVLRHKGAPALKSSALKLSWYQYFLVDVFAFLVGIIFIITAGIYVILSKIVRVVQNCCRGSGETKTKSPKKLKFKEKLS